MTDASLPEEFVAGFTEGEGCFALKFRRDVKKHRKGSPAYFGWQALFAIVLRKDDSALLQKIRDTLGCGTLSYTKDAVRLQVHDIDTLVKKVMPFFNKYKLHGKKAKDFELWKEALTLIARNKKRSVNVKKGKKGFVHVKWLEKDLTRLKEIREEMLPFKAHHPSFKWGHTP